eukprot:TRINITY_DN14937_c1_g1_i1.p1 TRINITY_DN14937_c1_g1~~TRINITY_DN14937_c1_g1_i1.p1  ORF type:complete len:552 (+),score=67.96 TRINITY_DN14937_c1_g1_i1:529-2184(+)
MTALAERFLISAVSLAALWQPCGGSFYEYVNEPNCSVSTPWTRPAPVVAGNLGFYGTSGDQGPGTLARLRLPRAVTLDEDGRLLYITDSDNHAVRMVRLWDSVISSVAGVLGVGGVDGDGGPAAKARFLRPDGLALDVSPGTARQVLAGKPRGILYVVDRGNHAVRLVDFATDTVSTLAGTLGIQGDSGDNGLAKDAKFNDPCGIAFDNQSRLLYISDTGNARVRMVALDSGLIFAVAPAAMFISPAGLAVDVSRQVLYVADTKNHVVVRLDLANPNATEVVVAGARGQQGGRGDMGTVFNGPLGPALGARLKRPIGLTLDVRAQRLYLADTADPAVRVIDLAAGNISVQATRSGYYNHELSEDDLGPVGLAIERATTPGFTAGSVYHDPLSGGSTIMGQFFYFNPNLGYGSGFKNASGILRALQYRAGVLIWAGYINFRHFRYGIGPTRQSNPDLTFTGERYPPPVAAPDQFEIGDVIFVPELASNATEEAQQVLYMAEGHQHVVRAVDLAAPVPANCGDPAVTGLPSTLWDMVPYQVGGNWRPPPVPPR